MLALLFLALMIPLAAFTWADGTVDWSGMVQTVVNALGSKNYVVLALALIILLTYVVKMYGAKLWPPLGSGKAAWVTAVIIGALSPLLGKALTGASLGGMSGVISSMIAGVVAGLASTGTVRGVQVFVAKKDQ